MDPYAWACRRCSHPASRHLLDRASGTIEGPYRCDCSCEINRDENLEPIWSRERFEGTIRSSSEESDLSHRSGD